VLDRLERVVMTSPFLQIVVLRLHEQAFSKVIPGLPQIRNVAIIGGGLFPRTAIILRKLLPAASITIIDRSAASLASARQFLGSTVATVESDCSAAQDFNADLVIVPLAFVGDRDAFYRNPPAATVIVHDWIWRRRGEGRVVSWWLLKRVNVVRRRVEAQVGVPRRAA
jgi:threonine dehydrogenase-like Zn-dependent dehydrogenase